MDWFKESLSSLSWGGDDAAAQAATTDTAPPVAAAAHDEAAPPPPPGSLEFLGEMYGAGEPANDQAKAAAPPADTAAPADPVALEKMLDLSRQVNEEVNGGTSWLFGADKDKVMKLVEGSPETIEAMRTQSPEVYRMMRANVLGSLDEEERQKALALMPEASLNDLNRERHQRGELSEEMNEEVKKISPDRRKELEEAVSGIKGSQGLLSDDVDAVRDALAGKSPAEIEAMRRLWLDKYPGSVLNMDQFLKAHYDGDEGTEVNALLTGDKAKATAGTLFYSLSGMNDNKTALASLEKIKDPAERLKVAEEFKKHWSAKLEADGDKEELSKLPADPLAFLESVAVSETDGIAFHDSDSDVAKHLIHGDKGKAAAVKLDAANGWLNDDEEAGWAALDGMNDPAMRAQLEAELKARGTSLDEQLGHYDGDEAHVALAKLEGNKAKEAAARVKVAGDGAGTTEADMFKAFEGKKREEREKIIAEYNKLFGKESGREDGRDFNEMLTDELDEQDVGRIVFLDDQGKLDPKFALKYAVDGAGTNDDMAKDALKRMKPEDRAQLVKDKAFMSDMFNLSDEEFEKVQKDPSYLPKLLMKDRNFLDSLDVQEVSGRTGFDVAQLLLGDDYNADGKVDAADKIARAKDAQEFARGEGAGVLAKAADAIHVNDSEVNLDLNYQRILDLEEKMQKGELSAADKARLDTVAGYHNQDIKEVLAQRDEFTNVAAGATAATVGTIVTILTAGGASPAVVAALSALASGSAGLGMKVAIQGDHLSNEEVATDLAMMVAQAGSGGLLAGDKAGALFAKLGDGLGKYASSPAGKAVLSKLAEEAAKGGSQALAPALVSALANPEVWKGDGDGAALVGKLLLSQVASGAASNVATAGISAKVDNKMLAAFLGGTASGTMSELINNHEGIAKAIREGRMTPEALQSIVSIAQSAASNMAEDGSTRARGGGDGPDAAPPDTLKSPVGPTVADAPPVHVDVVDAAPVDSGAPTRRPQAPEAVEANGPDTLRSRGVTEADRLPEPVFPDTQRSAGVTNDADRSRFDTPENPLDEGSLLSDSDFEVAHEYGDRLRQEAGQPEFVPIELQPEARPEVVAQPEGPRPFEDQFQERLEGEGDYSDDPDLQGRATAQEPPAPDSDGPDTLSEGAPPDTERQRVRPRDEDPVEREKREFAERHGIPYYGPNEPLPRFDLEGESLLHFLGKDPGNEHIERIAGDGEATSADAVGAAEGNRRLLVMDHLRTTPEGRAVLAEMRDKDSKLTMRPEGSYVSASRVNIDASGGESPADLAGHAAHEGHHLATYDDDVDIHNMTREEYRAASLRNEGEAQANQFEHHRNTGKAGAGETEVGYNEYHMAYNHTYDELLAMRPDLTPEQIHALAKEQGVQALVGVIAASSPSTSYATDENGRKVLKPGAPDNYDDYYGQGWDKHHGVGTEAELPLRDGIGTEVELPLPLDPDATAKKELDDKTVKKDYSAEARARRGEGQQGGPKRNDVPMYAQRGPSLGDLYAQLDGIPPGPARDDKQAQVMKQIAELKFKNPDWLLANGLISPAQHADPSYLPDLFASAQNPSPHRSPDPDDGPDSFVPEPAPAPPKREASGDSRTPSPERDAATAEAMRQIAEQKFKNPDWLLANGLISPEQHADPSYLPDLFASAENPSPLHSLDPDDDPASFIFEPKMEIDANGRLRPQTQEGQAAAAAADQLFSLEKALAKRTEVDWSGETYEEYIHDQLTGVEASIRQLASGNGSQNGQCTAESLQWQKMLARQGVQATVMNYEPAPGPDGQRRAIGHRWLVAGDVIMDPTFSQMFSPVDGDANLAPLPNGKVWLEPFVGTYDQMVQRVTEAIAAGHMPDEVGNDPAEVIERNWGISPPADDGMPRFASDVKPFGKGDGPE